MNIRKIAVLSIVALAMGSLGFAYYEKNLKPKEVNVSLLKAKPQDYLGKVKVTGKTGKVWAEKGIVEMLDDKACCNLFLIVPQTAEQGRELQTDQLYSWEQISSGWPITVKAEIKQDKEGYLLVVDKAESGGKTVIARK